MAEEPKPPQHAQPPPPPPGQRRGGMSKYERLSLVTSSLALLVALSAAVITPWVTYHWLDTSTKEYERRGRFAVVRFEREEPAKPNAGQAPDPKGSEGRIFVEAKNVGERPIEYAQVFLVYPAFGSRSSAAPTVTAYGRAIAEKKEQGSSVFFTLAGAIAPGDSIAITVTGSVGAMSLSTKHGDSTLVYQQGSGGGTSIGW
jgi:hypothetical protein